jgi:hypothetical protein
MFGVRQGAPKAAVFRPIPVFLRRPKRVMRVYDTYSTDLLSATEKQFFLCS